MPGVVVRPEVEIAELTWGEQRHLRAMLWLTQSQPHAGETLNTVQMRQNCTGVLLESKQSGLSLPLGQLLEQLRIYRDELPEDVVAALDEVRV